MNTSPSNEVEHLIRAKSALVLQIEHAKQLRNAEAVERLSSEAAALEKSIAEQLLVSGLNEEAAVNLVSAASCLIDANRSSDAHAAFTRALEVTNLETLRAWIRERMEVLPRTAPGATQFYERLRETRKDAADLADCIAETADRLAASDTSAKKPGILLGKIQSGKTRAFIGVIALCFDRGYDIAIVLTKGTKALAEQTYARLRSDLREFIDAHRLQVFDILHVPENLVPWELKQKIVMVVKKERNNLRRTFRALMETYPDLQHKKVLIVDDEADYASVTYRLDRETGEVAPGVINSMIDDLRSKVAGSDFLQVTATPYSLYLQPDDALPEVGYTFLPKRPAFTILLPTHADYVGGESYFASELDESKVGYYVFSEIPVEERDALAKSDGRRFKLDGVLETKAIAVLRRALTSFIVGGCIRQLQQLATGSSEKYYSIIIHTERARASHDWQIQVVDSLLDGFQAIARAKSSRFESLVSEAYSDLVPSLRAAGLEAPSPEAVMDRVAEAVVEGRIMATKVNSETDVKQLLDETGQLKLRTPLNVFVGGQILDRGITVANLIGFYYGRNPQRFQQDTVLQHSRMYGARPLADLAVTRFYTTKNIHDVMRRIYEFDTALREAFQSGGQDNGVYFLRRDESGQVTPCSPNKLLLSDIQTVKPFSRFVPYGFQTIAPSYLRKETADLDRVIQALKKGEERDPVLIHADEALDLLRRIERTLEFDDTSAFDWTSVAAILGFLAGNTRDPKTTGKSWLLIRRDRDNSRKRADGVRFFDAPDTSHIEGDIARRWALTAPMLMLFRQNGEESKGWRGAPFWWPVLYAPRNTKTSIFAGKLAH